MISKRWYIIRMRWNIIVNNKVIYLGKYHQEIYKIYEDAKHLNNSEKIYILTKPRWLSRWRTYSRMDVSKIYRRT